jgi:hypothetical protein
MKAHWLYFKYVLRHKKFVYQEGRSLGLGRWQLLCHDLSKFRWDEWRAYALYFYDADGALPDTRWHGDFRNWVQFRDKVTGRQEAFDAAWLKHLHRNPHHWQHWILRNDDGTTVALEMPTRYCIEMLADWVGAGRAIHGRREVVEWYTKNADKMIMHPNVRSFVETLMMAEYTPRPEATK